MFSCRISLPIIYLLLFMFILNKNVFGQLEQGQQDITFIESQIYYKAKPYTCLQEATRDFANILNVAVDYGMTAEKPGAWNLSKNIKPNYTELLQKKLDDFISNHSECLKLYNPTLMDKITNSNNIGLNILGKLEYIMNSTEFQSTSIINKKVTLTFPCSVNCNKSPEPPPTPDIDKQIEELLPEFTTLQTEFEQLKTFPPENSYLQRDSNNVIVNFEYPIKDLIEQFEIQLNTLEKKIDLYKTTNIDPIITDDNKEKFAQIEIGTLQDSIQKLKENIIAEKENIEKNIFNIKTLNKKNNLNENDIIFLNEITKHKSLLSDYTLFKNINSFQKKVVQDILNKKKSYKILVIIIMIVIVIIAVFIVSYLIYTKKLNFSFLRPKQDKPANRRVDTRSFSTPPSTKFNKDDFKERLSDSLRKHKERIELLEENLNTYKREIEDKIEKEDVEKIFEDKLELEGKKFVEYVDKKMEELKKQIEPIQKASTTFEADIHEIKANIKDVSKAIAELNKSMDDEYHQLIILNRDFLNKLESIRKENGKLFAQLSNYFITDRKADSGEVKELQAKEFISKPFNEIRQFYQQAGAFSNLWKKVINNEKMSPEEKRELKYRMMDLAYNKSLSLELVNVRQWAVKNMRFFDDLATELMNDKLNNDYREEELDSLNTIMGEFFKRKYVKVFPGDVVNSNLHDILGALEINILEDGVVAKIAFPGIYLIRNGQEILKDKCRIDVNRKYRK